MSYFLCGSFLFKADLSLVERENFAFEVAAAACANRLSLQLGVCITQPIVFEILGENRPSASANKLPFLITDSPIADVSDNLIDFNDVGGGVSSLSRTLGQLQSLFSEIKETEVVASVTVYFSEGFDERYRKVTSLLTEFAATCLEIFTESNETVSLCVSISLI
jgi:hypothetical protein